MQQYLTYFVRSDKNTKKGKNMLNMNYKEKSSFEKSETSEMTLGSLFNGSYLNFLHLEYDCIMAFCFLQITVFLSAVEVPCSQYAHCGSIFFLKMFFI